MSTKEELLKRLSEGVLEMEEDDVAEAAQEYIDAGYPALDAINQGLIDGMNQASELFEEEEYFVTDLLLCSDAMYAGINVLRPYLPEEKNDWKNYALRQKERIKGCILIQVTREIIMILPGWQNTLSDVSEK